MLQRAFFYPLPSALPPPLIVKVCGGFKIPRSPSNAIGVTTSSKGPVMPGIAKVKPKSTMEEITRPFNVMH